MQPGEPQGPLPGSLPGWEVAPGVPAIQLPDFSVLLVPREGWGGWEEAEGEFSSSLPFRSDDQLEPKTRAPESLEMRVTADESHCQGPRG